MDADLKKVAAYYRLKWVIICLVLFLFLSESALGLLKGAPMLVVAAVLLLFSLSNLVLRGFLRRDRVPGKLPAYFMISDIVLMTAALYFNGGMESTWWFLPVFVILAAGYIYNIRTALFFAGAAFVLFAVTVGSEYAGLIGSHSVYNMTFPEGRRFYYLVELMTGRFALYFSGALISGHFGAVLGRTIDDLRKKSEEAEKAKGALMNVAQDLEASKSGLEEKVRERTASLEELREGLERKVRERTTELEQSRKAILHMMKDLKEDVEKLKTVDRMKTEFLSIVSHELKTPLTPIYEYTALLKEGMLGEINEKQDKALEAIKRQSAHLRFLIEGVLDMTKLELGKQFPVNKEPVSLNAVAEELGEALQFDLKKAGLSFEAEIPPEVSTINVDPSSFRRLLLNLLGNAIKFTPENGKVRLEAGAKADMAEIRICDTGLGIAKENIEKVFDRFYQVDASYTRKVGGLGMGLAIARGIAEAHDGTLRAESDGLGRGARFIISVPL